MALIIVGVILLALAAVIVSFRYVFSGVEHIVTVHQDRQDIEEGRIRYVQCHMARYWEARQNMEMRKRMEALVEKMKNTKINLGGDPQ